jgi:hypothetical protein
MSDDKLPNYPFCVPSYVAAFDDGQLAEQELKLDSRSWRSEGYADVSNVQIYDHHNGEGNTRSYDDLGIDALLVHFYYASAPSLLLTPRLEGTSTPSSVYLVITDST